MVSEGERIICAGGGYFGAKAAEIARKNGAHVLVIDKDERCLASKICEEVRFPEDVEGIEGAVLVIGDAIQTLINLLDKTVPDLIVPAVPGHVMGRVCKFLLESRGMEVRTPRKLIKEVLRGIPEKLVVSSGDLIITSYMPEGNICAENCTQPEKCPVTGRKKPAPMYKILEFSIWDVTDHGRIFISRQIGGAGGINGSEVFEELKALERISPPFSMAVGTSCPCHGILNVFEIL
ncbi:MAG: hypothetical protein ACXQS7_05805 [Candidatus Syntropharchaeia archaeon]